MCVAPHSSTLAWKIPWMEEPGWAAVHGVAKSRTRLSDFTFTFHFHFSLSCIGEGNGNPLQRSCLENPRDGGAWWAAVYGVTQSRMRLSSSSRICLKASGSHHAFSIEDLVFLFPFMGGMLKLKLHMCVCMWKKEEVKSLSHSLWPHGL